MGKLSALGSLVTVSGLVLLIFKFIGAATGKTVPIVEQSLEDVLSSSTLDQIDNMNGYLHVLATTVVELPLYLHVIIIGVVLLIISGLVSK